MSSLLEVEDLHVWFEPPHAGAGARGPGRELRANAGERFGLVGESGCGKTTTILALMGLLPPNASLAGEVRIDGTNILAGGEDSVRPFRWKDIAMVFQGAMNALNPVKKVGWQIAEPMALPRRRRGQGRAEAGRRAAGACRHPGPVGGPLPARVLRRHATAGLDRHGTGLRAEDPAGRRADHGARRHGAGADPGTADPARRASSAWRWSW